MVTYQVQKAWKSYKENNLKDALKFFSEAAEKLGVDNFKANIKIIERKLGINSIQQMVITPVRVAAIMDTFTSECYSPECNLIHLRPECWEQQIQRFNPDFIFIESAWKGIDELWELKISRPDAETSSLILWCHKHSIPTIFWNKEDPIHFNRFLHIAKQVDYVFTVDYDMISTYKSQLCHNNVYFLPFAAQPTIHNPIEKYERKDSFCFAGSWYPQYKKRQEDFIHLANVAKKFRSLEIYDRNCGNYPFSFPDKYKQLIKGQLPYNKIDIAYKGYRYGINVSTIQNSSTMFARRIYELLASNTVVISNYARGLKVLFGDLVLASDNEEYLLSLLVQHTNTENNYRRFRLLGLRKVMREHTYKDRMNYICQILGLQRSYPEIFVVILATIHTEEEKKYILSTFELQTWKNSRIVLLQDFSKNINKQGKVVICSTPTEVWDEIKQEDSSTYFALLDCKDYYSEHYIEDLVLAHNFSNAEAFGKASYYSVEKDYLQLLHDGNQYRLVDKLIASQSLIIRTAITEKWLYSILANPRTTTPQNIRCLAIDEFSYIHNGALASKKYKETVNDIQIYDQGKSLISIFQSVESIQAILANNSKKFSLSGSDLNKLLPYNKNTTTDINNSLIFNIKYEISRKYIYSQKLFTPIEMNLNSGSLITMNGNGDLDVRFVIIFLDINKNKISHIILSNTEKKQINITKECCFIKIGIRLSGKGSFTLRKITTEEQISSTPLLKSSSIVLAKHYPDYDDIYRYGFVHTRLRAYKEHGINLDFFEFTKQENILYREFEGINIIRSGATLLDSLLASGKITCLCVHILERPLWEIIKKYLGKIKIIIWCHGAEIQLWHRRSFELTDKDEIFISKVKQASHLRFLLWQEIFKSYKYLQFVFVSQYFKNEVINDFKVKQKITYYIIPNYINSNLFSYKEKNIYDRLNILSIRPYNSLVYANDLMVKTILKLKEKPYFNKLKFTIYGDGKYFDSETNAIKNFDNVFLHKTFIRQNEIAKLHKEHGIILIPCRSDTQGVSRDEAMSSGLVPITNKVAAIPEFTDSNCAFVVEPENVDALAESIDKLYHNPDLFLAMSKNAAARPRQQCNYEKTIAKELNLIYSPYDQNKIKALNNIDYLVYSDTNPNIFDGSSIWLTSVLSILARKYKVATLLKMNLTAQKNTLQTVEYTDNIIFIEPKEVSHSSPLRPTSAANILAGFEHLCPNIQGVIIRGYEIADILIQENVFQNKILPYLSAFYHPGDETGFQIPMKKYSMVRRLLTKGRKSLIQTSFLAKEYENFLGRPFNWSLLPPAIPDNIESTLKKITHEKGIIHIGYGGKVYPHWGVEELINWTECLVSQGMKLRVHIAIAKIYNDNKFFEHISKRLTLAHIKVYKGLDRTETLSLMKSMDYAWCWREPAFENTTLEISMKLIENIALGIPCICYPSKVNIDFLGDKYIYFCKNKSDFTHIISNNSSICQKIDVKKFCNKYKYSNITIEI